MYGGTHPPLLANRRVFAVIVLGFTRAMAFRTQASFSADFGSPTIHRGTRHAATIITSRTLTTFTTQRRSSTIIVENRHALSLLRGAFSLVFADIRARAIHVRGRHTYSPFPRNAQALLRTRKFFPTNTIGRRDTNTIARLALAMQTARVRQLAIIVFARFTYAVDRHTRAMLLAYLR